MNIKAGDQFYLGTNKDTVMTILIPNTGSKFYNILVRKVNRSAGRDETCHVDPLIFTHAYLTRIEKGEEDEEII